VGKKAGEGGVGQRIRNVLMIVPLFRKKLEVRKVIAGDHQSVDLFCLSTFWCWF